MRIETKTADANGTFELGAGRQVLVEPANHKALVAEVERGGLTVLRDGVASKELLLVPYLPLTLRPWDVLRATGCEQGEAWRVCVVDDPEEALGARPPVMPPMRLASVSRTGSFQVQSGAAYELSDDLAVTNGAWTNPLDVRGYSRLLLWATCGNIVGAAGTPTVMLWLDLLDGASMAYRRLELTLANAPSPTDEALYAIELGLGVGEETSANTVRRGGMWPRVGARLFVNSTELEEQVTFQNGFAAQLWGYR
jgi:hypothetical protein